jgi:multidrug efflux pump subunit AcrB
MRALRWLFTKRGGAATPRLSSGSAALVGGIFGGTLVPFRYTPGVAALMGIVVAVIIVTVTYPQLRDEHARLHADCESEMEGAAIKRTFKRHASRIAILASSLLVGAALALATGSLWALLGVLIVAPAGLMLYGRIDRA